MVLRGGGAEHDARVAVAAVHAALRAGRAAEMMRFDEFRQVGAAHEFARVAEGVIKIEIVDAKLVGDDGAFVVRHAAGDPVVAADGFDVPDFVHVGNDDAVRFVRSVRFKQFGQTFHAFARGVDVRQHEGDDVFFADAAWVSGLPLASSADCSATSGSAASTRSLTAMVSVALMATLRSLTPASARIPRFGSTFGTMLYRHGLSGRSISTWLSTLR